MLVHLAMHSRNVVCIQEASKCLEMAPESQMADTLKLINKIALEALKLPQEAQKCQICCKLEGGKPAKLLPKTMLNVSPDAACKAETLSPTWRPRHVFRLKSSGFGSLCLP